MDATLDFVCAVYDRRGHCVRVVGIGAGDCDVFAHHDKAGAGVAAAVEDDYVTFLGVVYGILNPEVRVFAIGGDIQNTRDGRLKLDKDCPVAVHINRVESADRHVVVGTSPLADSVAGVGYRLYAY